MRYNLANKTLTGSLPEMPFFRLSLRRARVVGVVAVAAFGLLPLGVHAWAQEAVSTEDGPYVQPPTQEPAPVVREPEPQAGQAQNAQRPDAGYQAPGANYDPGLFQRRIPKEQLAFLSQFAGMTSNELYRDKQFRKLMHSFVPDCTYHYGSDKSMFDALDEVIQGSSEPVVVRDGRYVMLSGHMGPYLSGKGFLWIDMQEGIGLGAFYFHPTNGEPTPAVNVFSKQVLKEMLLDWSELPPAFAENLVAWEQADRVPPLTTRYFITGSNKKILLEHDEDFCMPVSGAGYDDCEQMNADASDKDMDAAGYLEQTHHVTNATAWMITDADQVAWIGVRDRTCGGVLDPLGCHIRMTQERTRVILHAPPRPVAHPIHR
jgi:uncharacterized protein YecT (DUF1311 family)